MEERGQKPIEAHDTKRLTEYENSNEHPAQGRDVNQVGPVPHKKMRMCPYNYLWNI